MHSSFFICSQGLIYQITQSLFDGVLLDFDKELERLNKEYTKIQGEIDRLDKKLSNAGFVAKAPAQVVEAEKVKLAQYKAQLDGIAEAKAKLENAHK